MKLISTGFLVMAFCVSAYANNILVQNVTTTGNNATNKTIQVQFDLSWDNSWRDAINWDAAWVFMKFKDANGLWQHVQLNTTGFANGTGTANTVQVTSDNIGVWVYRSAQGSGNFNSASMQLQWNYGLSGLTSVTGLEVRVYAIEMVYVPQGDFNVAKNFGAYNLNFGTTLRTFSAPGNNHPVINNRITPSLTYNDGNTATIRIKGDAGIDSDNNGTVDKPDYPTGYKAFYCYKYELTEQQYADFLNTLTATQRTTLGILGANITLSNGQYFSSQPNFACGNSSGDAFFSYADWSGVRPMSILEFNKVSYGPLQPFFINESGTCPGNGMYGYPAWGSAGGGTTCSTTNFWNVSKNVGSSATSSTNRITSGASYYGVMNLTGSAREPVVKMNYYTFTNQNGDGVLNSNGKNNVTNWNTTAINGVIIYIDQNTQNSNYMNSNLGFRYVRSAE
jgi:hypothetical protein